MNRTARLVSALVVASLGACVDQPQPQSGYNPGYGPPAGYNPGAGYGPAPGYGPPVGYNPGAGYNPGEYPAPASTYPGYPPAPTATAPAPAPVPTGSAPAPAPAPSTQAPGGIPWPFPFPTPGAAPGGQPSGAGSATPVDPSLAQAAMAPLMAYAQQEVPGMQREGNPVAAQFTEGQTLETSFQMLPGKCYSVLAVGAGMQQLDLQIIALTPVPGLNPVVAQSSGSGDHASLGGKGSCFKWMALFGINAKHVITATRGQGVAAGQLYVK